jgi:hypothetical protein
MDPEDWDDEDVAAVRWLGWLHSQGQAPTQAAWLVLRDDQKERIHNTIAHAVSHGAHGSRSTWACALRAELHLAHPAVSAPLADQDRYLPPGEMFPPTGNQSFCHWFIIPPDGRGTSPLTPGEALAIVREFTDGKEYSGPVPRRIGQDIMLIAPLDIIVLPVEDAQAVFNSANIDDRVWQPEFYYSRSLGTTARVEQAALSWIATRDALPPSVARTTALDALRATLLSCVAGARFLDRPERAIADFQLLQDHVDHSTWCGQHVTLASSLTFGHPPLDYDSEDREHDRNSPSYFPSQ